jgi:hypothetical protein
MIGEQETLIDAAVLKDYMREEVRAFSGHGIREVKEDDLLYAVWLRHQIEFNTAMLHMIRCGKLTVYELNREDMEASKLSPTQRAE